jgi:hypothetical protein
MMANVTYILNPATVSNVYFYLPALLALAISPFLIWLLISFLVKNAKKRFFLNILALIYAAFLIGAILPAALSYILTQIYQLMNLVNNPTLILQLYYLENELITVFTAVTSFAPFYYVIGGILLIADAALLWASP